MKNTREDEQRGTGFFVPGKVAGYSFPYCVSSTADHSLLNTTKDLYPVRLDLQAGQYVEVRFSAFARGEFQYSVLIDQPCNAQELMDSMRALRTPWEEVQSGAVDSGPWYTMATSTVFKIAKSGTFAFWPQIKRSVFSGTYAIHHQNILARALPPGEITVFVGDWLE